jgi:hypothetical protein
VVPEPAIIVKAEPYACLSGLTREMLMVDVISTAVLRQKKPRSTTLFVRSACTCRYIVLLIVVSLLLGCSNTPTSRPKYSEISGRIPPVAPDKGRLWFYLLKEAQGTVVRTSDGRELCRLAQYGWEHYVMSFVDLAPGSYELNNGLSVAPRQLRLQLVPGETKYVRLIFEMTGISGTVVFRIIPAEVAIQEMARCRYKGDMSLLSGGSAPK